MERWIQLRGKKHVGEADEGTDSEPEEAGKSLLLCEKKKLKNFGF